MHIPQSADQPDYSGIHELLSIEEALPNYNRYLCKRITEYFKKYSSDKDGLTLEFGAGLGTLAQIFREMNNSPLEVAEIDPELIRKLQSRGFTNHTNLQQIKYKFVNVFTSNVLEHIEQDVETLCELIDSMEIGGVLVIYVPAFPILFSSMDTRVGHVRRYRKKELVAKVTEAGFHVEECVYSDSVGFIASLFLRYLDQKNIVGTGNKKSLVFYDRVIYPLSVTLDRLGMRFLLGKNLFLVATNRGNTDK